MITEVEYRKAVHGERQTGVSDYLSGPALWQGLTVI